MFKTATPPAPQAPPPPPQLADYSVQAAGRRQFDFSKGGFGSTILTGGQGDTGATVTGGGMKKLLTGQ